MEFKKETIIRGGLLIVILILSIIIEFFYRTPLFEDSLVWIKNIQNSNPNASSLNQFISNFGAAPVLIPMLAISFLCFPINKSLSFLIVYISCYYWDNLLKVAYGSPRPYWIDSSLYKQCNGGYGNPSGHAFSSTGIYLAFWDICTDFKIFQEKLIGLIVKWILFLFSVISIIYIIFTRLYLGAHSLNQLIYGASLGLFVYLAVFKILYINNSTLEDIEQHLNSMKSILIYSFVYCALIILGIIVWACVDNKTTEYDIVIEKFCTLHQYRKFNDDGLFQILSMFGLFGGHMGLVFLFKKINQNYPHRLNHLNNWHYGSITCQIYRFLLCVLLASPLVLTFVISGSSSLWVVFIFKVSLPYLLAIFNLFGPCIFLSVKFRIANPEIWIDDSPNSNNKIQIEL